MTYKEFKKYVGTIMVPHKAGVLLFVKIKLKDFDKNLTDKLFIECGVHIYDKKFKEETMREMYKTCCYKIKSLGDNL